MMKTQNEVIQQGYNALINSLGITDTIRFIQYFNPGKGDYTKERHQWLDEKNLTDVLTEIKQFEIEDNNQYEEIIE
ncbi:MAG: hypothetical protein ACKO11_06330 [Cuspidothrix sp.]